MSTPLDLEPGATSAEPESVLRGREAHRGPFARPDRLDAPQARQGRARRRRRRRLPHRRRDLRARSSWACSATRRTSSTRTSSTRNTQIPMGPFGGMSWDFLFGLEPVNGRDIFSRVLYGSQISLLIAFLATLLSVVIGTVLGVVAGFFGGWVDTLISRTMDVFLAFPLLLFAIALAGVVPDEAFGLKGDALRIAVHRLHHRLLQLALHRPHHPRPDAVAARARVRRRRAQPGRPRARTSSSRSCCPTWWRRSSSTRRCSSRPTSSSRRPCRSSASASGRPPPRGAACSPTRRQCYQIDPMFMIWPGLAIFVTVLAFNLFGDGLRDALDPAVPVDLHRSPEHPAHTKEVHPLMKKRHA